MKLLITGAWNCTLEQQNIIKNMGHEILFMQNERDELPCGSEDVDGIICNGLFLHHDIQQFKNLKYIQLTSAGFDRVPVDYIKEHHITINNARDVYSIPMAEYTVCGVLELLKHSQIHFQNQTKHKWKKERTIGELYVKTVCVVGCGSVGNEVAKRFAALGCKIVGVDLFPRKDDKFETIYPLDKFSEAFSQSDVIVLTLPLTEQTKYLINKKTLDTVKNSAILVNISRGQIINTEDLVEALRNHSISGAVLDVFEEEPLAENSPLWDMGNVIITPHNSFVGDGNRKRLSDIIFRNLRDKSCI